MNDNSLREQILALTRQYYMEHFATAKEFTPGDRINYGGRFFDEQEMVSLVDASLDFWLTSGRYCNLFEKKLADYLNVPFCNVVNSGSSANLLAFMALTSPLLGKQAIRRGDEVITVAAGFPTTVAPIIQYGAIPVFVDVDIPSYNANIDQIEAAITSKTKAIMLAHTLGNPFNLRAVKEICDKHNLWLIEDNCDALGSRYEMSDGWHYTGTIGHIGTSSFYPPHHMTMGEGGAVYTRDPLLHKILVSLRDWGRDCICASGQDDRCGARFDCQYGGLPHGFDHKYVYSHFGYNLKITEMQAAIGCAQIEKLPNISKARRDNFAYLHSELEPYQDRLILPQAELYSDPSWFGFLMTVRDCAGVTRNELVRYLEGRNIQTRMLFAGNLVRQPCFAGLAPNQYRIASDLHNTDTILNNTLWIGVYPGLNKDMLQYMAESIADFIKIR